MQIRVYVTVRRPSICPRALSRRHCRKKFRLAAAAEKNSAKPAWSNFFSGFSRRKKVQLAENRIH